MLEIILIVVFAIRISRKAKAKGYKGWTWGLASVFAFIGGELLLSYLVAYVFNSGKLYTLQDLVAPSAPLGKIFMNLLLVLMGGIGGILLVKWRVDNLPDKKEQDRRDWLDSLGNNRQND